MKTGFYIKRLIVAGDAGEESYVKFKKGLNVITGPSDTGKSYIYQCVNYMLGGSDAPKRIKESKQYTKIYLEISTYSNTLYTLERDFSGGDFKLFKKGYDVVKLGEYDPVTLKPKHDAKNEENISSFLLKLSGINNLKEVKKNDKNETRTISFRDLKNLICIGEERIITEGSPFLSSIPIYKTVERSIFKFLITGKDDSNLEKKVDPKIHKAKLYGKLEILEHLITNLQLTIEKVGLKYLVDNTVEVIVTELENDLTIVNQEINNLTENRQNLWEEIKQKKSRKLVVNELLHRFNLLKEYYEADLRRLQFINEGYSYFSQLNFVNCSVCGNEMNVNLTEKGHSHEVGSFKQIEESCHAEAKKILLSLNDLKETVADLNLELAEINGQITNLDIEFKSVEDKIELELRPKSIKLINKLDNLLEEQKKLVEYQANMEKREELLIQKGLIETQINTKTKTKIKTIKSEDFDQYAMEIEKVCKFIKEELIDWNFFNEESETLQNVNIYFDKTKDDFIINDKIRGSYGKGYRAILYSAFVIGLMKYLCENELPHTRMIVLDSPLTTFQDKEKKQEEKMSSNIIESFYHSLSTLNENSQIIILENKVPLNDENMNHIRFTKKKTEGRYGFFMV
ncbi:AAA family ATPase [Bacillus cereus]|uniref:AAA family ATPase n=1 Tax=Bacillus cereus TaxID=1396 RepID=UPI0012927025|nr:AAA family ATPase [Bacillus cereus]QFX99693.1 AAA family ATPase [Bacillus cereus]